MNRYQPTNLPVDSAGERKTQIARHSPHRWQKIQLLICMVAPNIFPVVVSKECLLFNGKCPGLTNTLLIE
jgi:hypothetical protein